jgi:hypothetical protein
VKYLVPALAILLAGAGSPGVRASGMLRLEPPVPCSSTDDLLQYDDGLATWLTWGGLYRGVLFDLADFYEPVPGGFYVENVEFWFYHHSAYPWDTSDFYGEIWDGDAAEPGLLDAQAVLQASHYSAVNWSVTPPCSTAGQYFWVILNTSMSSGGWPALLGDGTPSTTGASHSFYSDDLMLWEPWIVSGDMASDYLIRVEGEPMDASVLETMTWGLVKRAL